MAVFRSTLTFTDEQKAFAPDLEPAFENLLRTLNVDEALITALKVNLINDRETFVGLDDNEAGFKNIAPDLGIDPENGGLAHKREVTVDHSMEASPFCFGSQSTSRRCSQGSPSTYDCVTRRLDVYDDCISRQVRKAYPRGETSGPIILRSVR